MRFMHFVTLFVSQILVSAWQRSTLTILNISLATDVGQDIICRLIPLIAYLRRHIPLKISTMFSNLLLTDIGLTNDVECHDFDASDIFFDSVRKKYVTGRIMEYTVAYRFISAALDVCLEIVRAGTHAYKLWKHCMRRGCFI